MYKANLILYNLEHSWTGPDQNSVTKYPDLDSVQFEISWHSFVTVNLKLPSPAVFLIREIMQEIGSSRPPKGRHSIPSL